MLTLLVSRRDRTSLVSGNPVSNGPDFLSASSDSDHFGKPLRGNGEQKENMLRFLNGRRPQAKETVPRSLMSTGQSLSDQCPFCARLFGSMDGAGLLVLNLHVVHHLLHIWNCRSDPVGQRALGL